MRPPTGRVRLAAAILGALLTGCVSSQTYQSSQAALGAERQAHQRARIEQQALTTRVAQLTDELGAAQLRLARQEQQIEQSELAASVARQERDRTANLVDQLREELGRAGDHLRAFSAEKRELQQAFKAARRAVVVKDLTLALPGPIAKGEVDLALADGEPLLRVPADRFWDRPSDLLGAVARVTETHPGARLEVRLPPGSRPESAEELRQSLRACGLGDQSFVVVAQTDPARTQVELALSGL
jgi:hypothetical protein